MVNIDKNIDSLITHLHALHEQSPFFVTFKEAKNLEILYCNKIMRDYVGCEKKDSIVGKTDYDFPWEKYADMYVEHERDTLKNNIYTAMFPGCDYQGNKSIFLCHRTPYTDASGVLGVLSHTYILPHKSAVEVGNILQSHSARAGVTPKTFAILNPENNNISLTAREQECLFYLLRGRNYKMIAEILKISHRTVETFVENLKAKFNALSKNELICKAIDCGYYYNIPGTLFNENFINSLE